MSGIHLVLGPPGAGKGLWLIRKVREVLLDTDQTIVTNFAVRLGQLNEHLQEEYPEKVVDIHERIKVLTYEETARFFLHRPKGIVLPDVTAEEEKRNVFPDYSPAFGAGGVCYIIDEADIYFGAREWASNGRSLHFYNKQHRKLGDTVFFCTQQSKMLDANIVRLCQDSIILKNLGKLRKGIFNLPPVFSWSLYYGPPSGASGQTPLCTGVFRLHCNGLENCFDTAAGVGMAGLKGDVGEKKKGPSIFWLIPVIALLGLLLVKAPMLLAKGIAQSTLGAAKSASEKYRIGSAPSKSKESGKGSEVPESGKQAPVEFPPSSTQKKEEKPEPPKVYLTGVAIFGGKAKVFLSNGESYSSDDRELEFLSKQMAVISGKTYRFAPPNSGVSTGSLSTFDPTRRH